jgi:hypothetical protein
MVDDEIGDGKLEMLEEYLEWDPLRKSKKRERRGNSQYAGDMKLFTIQIPFGMKLCCTELKTVWYFISKEFPIIGYLATKIVCSISF